MKTAALISILSLFTQLISLPAQAVLYSRDQRVDIVEAPPTIRQLAKSMVMIVKGERLTKQDNGDYLINKLYNYGPDYKLCTNEPFYSQKSFGGRCSAALVGPDLVLTAGHCVFDQAHCETLKYIFDFQTNAKGEVDTTLKADNVYSCKKLLVAHQKVRNLDYDLIQLDRPVVGRDPVKWDKDHVFNLNDTVFSIGFPMGLPMKYTGVGPIFRTFDTVAHAAINTYDGNSGGPVFDAKTNLLIGVMSDGEMDFVPSQPDVPNSCQRSNYCDEWKYCKGEIFTKINLIAPDLEKFSSGNQ